MTNFLPDCIIKIIEEFNDYKKFHKIKFKNIVEDINSISEIFSKDDNLCPKIIYTCWGNGWENYINSNDY